MRLLPYLSGGAIGWFADHRGVYLCHFCHWHWHRWDCCQEGCEAHLQQECPSAGWIRPCDVQSLPGRYLLSTSLRTRCSTPSILLAPKKASLPMLVVYAMASQALVTHLPSDQLKDVGCAFQGWLKLCIVNQANRAAEFWGGFVGVDVAIFQEVIEHLDPTPLGFLPACLFGSLQPKVAVISTPNHTYNAVLHSIQAQLLPNGLRNSDHRFEWWAQSGPLNLYRFKLFSKGFQSMSRSIPPSKTSTVWSSSAKVR